MNFDAFILLDNSLLDNLSGLSDSPGFKNARSVSRRASADFPRTRSIRSAAKRAPALLVLTLKVVKGGLAYALSGNPSYEIIERSLPNFKPNSAAALYAPNAAMSVA